jgi:tetratricopeptide (TPR) repeat protein
MTLPDWVRDSRWIRLGLQAAAVLAVLGLVAAGAWAWYRSQESRGLAALAEATALVQQAEGPEATSQARDRAAHALETVISEYPRLSALPQAAYQLGNIKYAAGQYSAARGAYELALAKGASGSLWALAGIGIGYTWEAEKNYPNAVQAYEKVAKTLGPKDFLYEEAVMADARAQELAGKPAVALEMYQRLLREAPDSRHAEDLRNRVAALRSRAAQ